MKRKLGLGAALIGLSIGAADAAVLFQVFSVVNGSDVDASYSVSFADVIAPILGLTTTRLDLGFALADGARNGATLGIALVPSALARAQAGNGNLLTTVLQSGTAQNFVGAGGESGVVALQSVSVKNASAVAKDYELLFSGQPADSGSARVLSVATAGVFAEGTPDGGSVAPSVNPGVAEATLNSAQVAQGSATAGGAQAFAPFADVYPSASGQTANIDCIALCTTDTNMAFTMSPQDVFGAVVRVESGRTGPSGPVTWTYLPGPQFGGFDCGVVGCDTLNATISFTLSARDAATLAFRFEIAAVDDVPVPAPASLALLGAALAGLAARRCR